VTSALKRRRIASVEAVPCRTAGGVLHHQVVVVLDQVPTDRVGQGGPQPRVGVQAARLGQVQLATVDLLDPWQQVEAQEPGDSEPDERLAVGVDIVGFDLHVGAVPHGETMACTSEAEHDSSWLCTAIAPPFSTVQ
jgi:hypothetical protein